MLPLSSSSSSPSSVPSSCANNNNNNNNNNNQVIFGFVASNQWQLLYHFVLAIFIGISLRLTTFVEATTVVVAHDQDAPKYKQQTAFLVSFGFTKAISNLIVGRMSDNVHFGRKIPHCMGWMAGVGLGIVLLLLTHHQHDNDNDKDNNHVVSWQGYFFANILLGAQQGWTWTTNIFMFLDILGPDHRALASGISNSLGYLSSACTNYLAAFLMEQQASFAFWGVLITCGLGLVLSIVKVEDTSKFVQQELLLRVANNNDHSSSSNNNPQEQPPQPPPISLAEIWKQTSWYNPSTAVVCLGGLMTNLVTSLAWGLVLIWGKQQSLSNWQLANIGSGFTMTKATSMIVSSFGSDRRQNRKSVLVAGFSLTVIGLLVTSMADIQFSHGSGGDDGTSITNSSNSSSNNKNISAIYYCLLLGGMIIGCGIGSVYCVMTGGISDHTQPEHRASAIGVYKLWRDSGYAVGGLLTGFIADALGGSFVTTTLVVCGLVGLLVALICLFYQEATTGNRNAYMQVQVHDADPTCMLQDHEDDDDVCTQKEEHANACARQFPLEIGRD